MYNFSIASSNEINKYNMENVNGHIFQTTHWCDFKSEWEQHYFIGKKSDGSICFSCSLLVRKLPYIGSKIGYIPRGFVCDYSNNVLIEEFAAYLKEFSKENGIAFVTVDADIHLKENNQLTKTGIETKTVLENSGFKFMSSSGKNFESIQPNFVFRLDISKKGNESVEETKKRVYNNFHNKWRYNIKLGAQRFLEVEWFDKTNITEDILDEFQRIMDITGERDNFLVRKKVYFKNLINGVSPYSRIYMVKYNLKADKENTLKKIASLEKEHAAIDAKIAEFINELKNTAVENGEKKIKNYQKNISKADSITAQIDKLKLRISKIEEFDADYIYLSGALYLYYGNKAWYLYGASSNDFRDTMPNFTMQWAMISDSIDLGLDIYDFRGVSGDIDENNPLYGLYKFKKGFGGDFVEFIGECDLIQNKFIYRLFKDMFPRYKKVRAKIANRKSASAHS